MKRVIKRDEAGLFVFNDGERLRPEGATRFSAEQKVGVDIIGVSHSGAMRASVWDIEVPRDRTEETWDNGRRSGEGMSPNQHFVCDSTRTTQVNCARAKSAVVEWCDVCLRALALDVKHPNKPWRGMTHDERRLLVADVARDGDINLGALGEKYLAAGDVYQRIPFTTEEDAELIERFVLDELGQFVGHVVAMDADSARRFATAKFGIPIDWILEVRRDGLSRQSSLGRWLVRYVK